MGKSISKPCHLRTEASSRNEYQSPQDGEVFELGDHSVPPTFTRAVLELSLLKETAPSAFPFTPEGSNGNFYGHKWIAKSTSAFITNTFGCPEESLLSKVFLQPSLPYFIASIFHKTHAPYSVVSATIILLQRYRSQLPPEYNKSKLTSHLLFIATYIYAVQEHWPRKEKVFDNEYWSRLSNFTAKDIGLVLAHFYDKLEGKVGVYSRFRTIINVKEKPVVILENHSPDPEELPESGTSTLKSKVRSMFTRKKRRGFISDPGSPCTHESC